MTSERDAVARLAANARTNGVEVELGADGVAVRAGRVGDRSRSRSRTALAGAAQNARARASSAARA